MKSAEVKTYVNYAIIIACFLFFKHIPPPAGLPPISMEIVGIFIGTLWGWITVSMGWPSILGILAFGLSDYTNMGTALSSSYGSQLTVMVVALLLLAAFVEQANLTDFVLDFLMKRKSCRGRPYVIFFYFLMAGYIAALLSYCNAVIIIFIGFFRSMMKKTGIRPYSDAVPCFFVGMLVSIMMSELSLPFKSTSIYSIGAYEAVTGVHVNLLKYVALMMPICVSIIILYVLICKYVFKPDLSPLINFSHESSARATLNKRQKFSLGGIIAGMLCLLLPSVFPADWEIASLLEKLGNGGLAMLVIAILMAVRVDNEPLMDLKKIAEYYPWPIFFCMAFLFPVAGAISSDALGIKQLITIEGEQFFQSIPTILAVVCLIILPAFFTNFMNNAVIGIITLSIYGTISASIDLNPNIVFGMIVFAANFGFFFPAANPMCAMAFAEKDIISFKQLTLYGLAAWAFLCVWAGLACYLWGGIIY